MRYLVNTAKVIDLTADVTVGSIDSLDFAILSGADANKFTLKGNQLTFEATDFEARINAAYRVKVQATFIRRVFNGDIKSTETVDKFITVTVTDLDDEAPTNPTSLPEPFSSAFFTTIVKFELKTKLVPTTVGNKSVVTITASDGTRSINKNRNLIWGKNDQHSKIYIPCNFEVHLITHLGVIAPILPYVLFLISDHVGWCTASPDTILKLDTLVMIQTKIGFHWSSTFRGEDF
jgi:hypothetical protein